MLRGISVPVNTLHQRDEQTPRGNGSQEQVAWVS